MKRSIRDLVRAERWAAARAAYERLVAAFDAENPPEPEGAGWAALFGAIVEDTGRAFARNVAMLPDDQAHALLKATFEEP